MNVQRYLWLVVVFVRFCIHSGPVLFNMYSIYVFVAQIDKRLYLAMIYFKGGSSCSGCD